MKPKPKIKITNVRTVVNRGTVWRCLATTQVRIEMPLALWEEIKEHYHTTVGWVCKYNVYTLPRKRVEVVSTADYCWAYAYWMGYIQGKGVDYESVYVESDEIHDRRFLKD